MPFFTLFFSFFFQEEVCSLYLLPRVRRFVYNKQHYLEHVPLPATDRETCDSPRHIHGLPITVKEIEREIVNRQTSSHIYHCRQVEPFDSGDARKILAEQLGKPLDDVFLDADTAFETPIAAASLGQVS